MNKFGVVLGAVAVAAFSGCKDPDYRYASSSQTDVRNADTVAAEPISISSDAAPTCRCAPGTKHATPCKCGASDCKCVVESKPVAAAPVAAAPVVSEPEFTVYVVQNGDSLSKISKRYNVTINGIRKLNPSVKKDVIYVGQKLKLPGRIDVGVQTAPKASTAVSAKKPKAKKSFVPYAGATKEYVVKNGDTLGAVAYGHGINIRQLKELNGLAKDSLQVGQKLKVPAEKVVKSSPKKEAKKAAAPAPAEKKESAPVADESAAPVAEQAVQAEKAPAAAPEAPAPAEAAAPAAPAAPAEASAETAKPTAPATTTYVVQEGDDMTGVSIRWGVSAADIRELNNLAEGDQLVPGQIIKLPAEAQQ